jgi:RAB protein geranylgeranyltransferase component A
LDKNDFYGNYYSSFNLQTFHQLMQNEYQNKSNLNNHTLPLGIFNCESSELKPIPIGTPKPVESQPEVVTSLPIAEATSATDIEEPVKIVQKPVQKTLLDSYRQFNLDITPKILFSRGAEVELFVSSGVGRYLEFKTFDNSYLLLENDLQLVIILHLDILNRDVNDPIGPLLQRRRIQKQIYFFARKEGIK